MEKIMVTKKQGEAIEDLISTGQRVATINRLLDGEDFFNEFYAPLREMKPKDIIKSLIDEIGYEVEPEYKEGEWIYITDEGTHGRGNNVRKIKELHLPGMKLDDGWSISEKSPYIRHATPEEIKQEKERRWWKSHGRDPWDLKHNDMLTAIDEGYVVIVRIVAAGQVRFYGGNIFTDLEDVKELYRVSCFSENRLDVNTNE